MVIGADYVITEAFLDQFNIDVIVHTANSQKTIKCVGDPFKVNRARDVVYAVNKKLIVVSVSNLIRRTLKTLNGYNVRTEIHNV